MPKKGQFKKNATKRSIQQRKDSAKPVRKRDRVIRNKARRKAVREGRAKKGDGMDVHHVGGQPGRLGNKTRVIPRSKNRSMGGKKGGKK